MQVKCNFKQRLSFTATGEGTGEGTRGRIVGLMSFVDTDMTDLSNSKHICLKDIRI